MSLVYVALAVVLALFLLYVFFSMSKESFGCTSMVEYIHPDGRKSNWGWAPDYNNKKDECNQLRKTKPASRAGRIKNSYYDDEEGLCCVKYQKKKK